MRRFEAIESNPRVCATLILDCHGGFCVYRLSGGATGTTASISPLYRTRQEAIHHMFTTETIPIQPGAQPYTPPAPVPPHAPQYYAPYPPPAQVAPRQRQTVVRRTTVPPAQGPGFGVPNTGPVLNSN